MAFGNIKERILLERLEDRDKQAFIQCYDLYLDDIYRFVFFKVASKEEAEDITSQVFLKIWDYVQNGQLKEHKMLKPLLYKSARNAVIDHYRRAGAREADRLEDAQALGQEPADERQDIAEAVALADDFAKLSDQMRKLKDEYREALVLRFVNELSIAEIAQVLGKSKGNVRVLLYRAVAALKELVK